VILLNRLTSKEEPLVCCRLYVSKISNQKAAAGVKSGTLD
jgi:hypothetical protein